MSRNKRSTLEKSLVEAKADKYKEIFNSTPVAIVVQNWTPLIRLWKDIYKEHGSKTYSVLLKKKRLVRQAFNESKILEANKGALGLFNSSNHLEFKENFSKAFSRDFAESLISHLQFLLEGDMLNETSFKVKPFKGTSFFALMRSAVLTETGDFSRVVLTFQDISERVSLENFLQKLAQTDGLTQLYNHLSIYDRLEEEVSRAVRYKLNLSCLMIDCDLFKKINDTYGHIVGDRLLKLISQCIKTTFRRSDVSGRYGGDEFLVILTETSIEGAVIAAERFQKLFQTRLEQEFAKDPFSFTFSVGIAGFPSRSIKTAKDLVAKADKAMYQAKESGGDCIKVVK